MPARATNSSEQMQLLIAINDSIGADNPTLSERIHRLRELHTNTLDSVLRDIYIREINRYTRALNRTMANQTAASRRLNTTASASLAIPVAPPQPQEPSITDILQAKGVIIPNEYLCPITLELMKDPVILEDGHVYEKTAIQIWFKKNNTNPLTKKVVNRNTLISCHAIRNMIQDFIKTHTESSPALAQPTSAHKHTTVDASTQTDDIHNNIIPVPVTKIKGHKPKREPSEYNMFVKERMSVYRQRCPSELPKDIMKKIGQEWKEKKQIVS